MSLTGEPIILLGTSSSASALAVALEHAGVTIRNETLGDAAAEDSGKAIERLALDAFGLARYKISFLPPDWVDWPCTPTLCRSILRWLDAEFNGSPSWGYQTDSSVLLPLYRKALTEGGVDSAVFWICVRHPLTALSDRGTLDDRVVGLWLYETLGALSGTKKAKRRLTLYEDMVREPKSEMQALAEMTHLWRPSASDLNEASSFLLEEFRGNQQSIAPMTNAPPMVDHVYDLCRKAAANQRGFNEGMYDQEIDRLCNELKVYEAMIRAVELPERRMVLSWRDANGTGTLQEDYFPTGSWETKQLKVDAMPGSFLLFDPYQIPCHFWIRKAVWHISGREQKAIIQAGANGLISSKNGLMCLTCFGPGPAVIQVPTTKVDDLEIEFKIEAGDVISYEVLEILRSRLTKRKSSTIRGRS